MIKVFVVGYGTGYASWIHDKQLVNDIEDADVIVFTGGQDINPAIYGCKKHSTTYFTPTRDDFELSAYAQVRPNQVCYGACRGAQLGAAINGAILVQDIENHWCSGNHEISRFLGESDLPEELSVPSLHHQMVYPYDLPKEDYDLLYVSKVNRSPYYHGDGITDEKILKIKEFGEPEVMVFHRPGKPVFFGVQGHPEMLSADHPTNVVFNKILRKLIQQQND